MEDTELYRRLLGITPPWRVTQVGVDLAAERIDVWVAEAPGTQFHCAGCGEARPVYDHTAEQVWQHLDTCQCRTYVHARLPRHTLRHYSPCWRALGSFTCFWRCRPA